MAHKRPPRSGSVTPCSNPAGGPRTGGNIAVPRRVLPDRIGSRSQPGWQHLSSRQRIAVLDEPRAGSHPHHVRSAAGGNGDALPDGLLHRPPLRGGAHSSLIPGDTADPGTLLRFAIRLRACRIAGGGIAVRKPGDRAGWLHRVQRCRPWREHVRRLLPVAALASSAATTACWFPPDCWRDFASLSNTPEAPPSYMLAAIFSLRCCKPGAGAGAPPCCSPSRARY